ncbi:MAG: hypothetical protein C3F06_01555 [Candidatus Methanoperedenaceae archaeon]|nr:MAG: hypothetical protein C3F06_01555 [Candidatus Methanoperedenaceae archaeon]
MVIKMESKEIAVSESIIQKIDYEIPLEDITADLENGDKICSNFNPDIPEEGALEDLERTMGELSVLREFIANKMHTHNRSPLAEEINMGRASYLLNVDDMLEEMLS